MTVPSSFIELQVGHQGRMVIPVSLRRAWHMKSGETLLARIEGERLVLERPAQIVQRVKQRYAALHSQSSMADELVQERRNAAQQESAE